jgi:oxidase EvaA
MRWLKEQNERIKVRVDTIGMEDMRGWHFDNDMNLRHDSGKFFSIEGIEVKTNWGAVTCWQQPIINQPEIGYLGLITKEFNGVLYFLLQAKVEPGNVNCVQLSPTLQATKSNYSQVHKGKKPLYLEYFVNVKKEHVLLDQLQSEQGARFLKKRNRNIIIKVEEDIPVYENFIWLTLAQIKRLAQTDNLVNMDTRTVISGIPLFSQVENFLVLSENNSFETGMLQSCLASKGSYQTKTEILSWFTSQKCKYELSVDQIPMRSVKDWIIEDKCIRHIDDKFFKVIATEVSISNREVTSWCQPLVQPVQQGLVAFIVKRINGIYHFLVQAKLECGNLDILEMAPTVQCITGSYSREESLPFLRDVLNAQTEQIKIDTLQSEEGGRFYHEQNRNLIIEVGDDFPIEVPDNYTWMTLNQLIMFLEFNNYLNIQARSLISLINFCN